MRAVIIGIMGLLGSWGHAGAEPLLEGRVRLDSGQPVSGGQVLLFDLADLRAAPLAAATDGSGRFTLSLSTLAGAQPERFELGANYPNPFNPSTVIPYQLPASMHVRLEVFNSLGQRVATLVEGERPAGSHTASWDATDARGQAVAAGVYLCRLSGDGVQATRSMLLVDGQAGVASGGGMSSGLEGDSGAGEDGGSAPVYGLTVSGPGLVPYVDPAFRVEAGMAPVDVVIEAPGSSPRAKAASSDRTLGDVDNTGKVDFFDALLVALYSLNPSVVIPNNGDISLGDVNADGQVDLSDAWVIAAWLNDPSDPVLPAGIGEPVGAALASLSPDPSTVTIADDGRWHRFTVQAGEPVSVVANPEGTGRRLEITTRSGRGNFCPAEADDDVSRDDGQTLYLSGCVSGPATVELRRASDGTVLRAYTFEVTGIPSDLVVESVSVSDSTLTPGQSFTLGATVRNQGTSGAEATTLRWYRSSNRTISTRDAETGTVAVGALAAEGTGAKSIRLTAPSTEDTYYYGACVESLPSERGGNNCSAGVRVTVAAGSPDLIVESVSVSENFMTPGQSFRLSATVRNSGTREASAATLRWYRSSAATISTRDTEVGTSQVGGLAASGTSVESITQTAPSSEGTYYYGVCVESVAGESDTRNNCSIGVQVTVEEPDTTPVTIPDANLRAAIETALGKEGGATITIAEMKTLTELFAQPRAQPRRIRDLSGLEAATNLQRLGLSLTNTSDLSPISGLTRLRDLFVDLNDISDLSPLARLTNLRRLFVNANKVRDLSPLAGLTALYELRLADNNISDLSPLEGLTNLVYLSLAGNRIANLSPLEGLTNLVYLSLASNRIANLSPLEGLPHLRELKLRMNNISDVAPLLANTGLGEGDLVDVRENPLSDVSINLHLPTLQGMGVRVLVTVPPTVVTYTDPEIYGDNVFVLPVTEDLAAGGLPLREYSARFFGYFNDEFDFLVFVPSLRVDQLDPGAFVGAFYSPVRNDVQGIGLESFFNGGWGSSRKLQGVVFLSHGVVTEFSRGLWDSERLYSNLIEGPLLHELTHRWANYLGIPARYSSHWGFSSANGVLGGFDIASLVDHGNGRYRSSSSFNPIGVSNKPLSPIELYLAGFIPPDEVPDLWVSEDATPVADDWGPLSDINENWVSWDFRSFSASQVGTHTIEDIIAKHGPRVPDYSQAQRNFRAAVILLITEEHPATQWMLENLSGDASLFSYAGEDEFDLWYNFYEATGGRATITMDGLPDLQRRGSEKRLLPPSSYGTPPQAIVDPR